MRDERGSIVSVANAAGTTLAINSYDEYGIPASSNLGRFGYTGQTWLPEVGLYYYKARMYSPTLGRFMQTDPIGYADGMNMYAYVGGDPINYVDPLGLQGTPPPPDDDDDCENDEDCNDDIVVTAMKLAAIYIGGSGGVIFDLAQLCCDGPDIVVNAPEVEGPLDGCGEDTGPTITVSTQLGATLFAGVVGGTTQIDGGLSVPVRSLLRGSLRGTQTYITRSNASLAGFGAFIGGGFGRSYGIASGPVRGGYNVQDTLQAGGARGAGAEITLNATPAAPFSGNNPTMPGATASAVLGGGGYIGGGRRYSDTYASSQFGCP